MASFAGVSLAAIPKCFLPIANLPLYHYMAKALNAAGANLLIFCVPEGLHSEVAALLSASPPPLDYLIKETVYGSGGSLLEVADEIKDESFWVINGDLLLDTDLAPMLTFHGRHRALATAASIQIQEAPWWMERIETDVAKGIRAIHRIHPFQCKRSKLRPVGLYLFDKAVLDYIPHGRYFDLKEQLFPPLHETGAVTGVWEVPGYCRTISSIEDYFFANQDVLLGLAKPPQNPVTGAGFPKETDKLQIAPTAKILAPAVTGSSSRIDENALVLGLTTIGRQCQIGAGSIINDCLFLGKAAVGRGVYLDSCVICEDVTIQDGAILREVAIVKGQSGEQVEVPLSLRERTDRNYANGPQELKWRSPGGPFYRIIKRFLDIFVSIVGFVITAPLLIIIALAIKLDSPGPILLRQERHGQHGRNFIIYKFRTMVENAPDLKRRLESFNEVDGPMFKMVSDPRVTRVGKWLRQTNLDELPQFWNVLKGDMSLVGPRPLSMEEMLYNPRWRDARLSVPPGITGLWQVNRHSGLNFSDWIGYDIEYVQRRSLWLDLKILWNTLYKIFPDFWQGIRNSLASRAHSGLEHR
jgi:lipopolysaccharide/colanic/teichoic acid biosynthesis glycosyltransferase